MYVNLAHTAANGDLMARGAMSLPRISLSHSISFHIFNTDLYGSGADFDILETTFPVTVQFFNILGLQIR